MGPDLTALFPQVTADWAFSFITAALRQLGPSLNLVLVTTVAVVIFRLIAGVGGGFGFSFGGKGFSPVQSVVDDEIANRLRTTVADMSLGELFVARSLPAFFVGRRAVGRAVTKIKAKAKVETDAKAKTTDTGADTGIPASAPPPPDVPWDMEPPEDLV